MLFLTLVIYQAVASLAKVIHYQGDREFQNDNGLPFPTIKGESSAIWLEKWDDPLWVLKLDDSTLNISRIRTATIPEEEYFDSEIGPKLHRHTLQYLSYKHRQTSRREKKDDPNKCYPSDFKNESNKEIDSSTDTLSEEARLKNINKSKVIQMINKFVLSFQKEPDTNLPETMVPYEQPTLTLYFKGPFTVIFVNYERLEWQFIIKPPSSLPKWFYDEHSDVSLDKNGMYAIIPEAVKSVFFEKLFNSLATLFSYPM